MTTQNNIENTMNGEENTSPQDIIEYIIQKYGKRDYDYEDLELDEDDINDEFIHDFTEEIENENIKDLVHACDILSRELDDSYSDHVRIAILDAIQREYGCYTQAAIGVICNVIDYNRDSYFIDYNSKTLYLIQYDPETGDFKLTIDKNIPL